MRRSTELRPKAAIESSSMVKRRIDGLYHLAHVHPQQVVALSRLFADALEKDFAYYGADYLRATKRQNTVSKLALGSVRPNRLLLGLWAKRTLVGYIIGSTRPGSDCGDIFWLYVEPAHRGRGLGADLLNEAFRWLQAKQLRAVELVTYDHAPFYERYGFVTERLAKGFIGGQDVCIMRRSLT